MPDTKKFSLPTWAWFLWLAVLAISYIGYMDISRLAQSSSNVSNKDFYRVLQGISLSQLVALGLIYKGKKIGIWILGGIYLITIIANYLFWGTVSIITLVAGYATLLAFRFALNKS